MQKYGVTAAELANYKAALMRDSEHLAEQWESVPSVDTLDYCMECLALDHTFMAQEEVFITDHPLSKFIEAKNVLVVRGAWSAASVTYAAAHLANSFMLIFVFLCHVSTFSTMFCYIFPWPDDVACRCFAKPNFLPRYQVCLLPCRHTTSCWRWLTVFPWRR